MAMRRSVFAAMTLCSRSFATQPIVIPPARKHTATVVFLHGLGDSGKGVEDIGHAMASSNGLSHIKIILPTAPVRPVTLNGGAPMAAWYDIVGLGARENERCDGIHASTRTIVSILDAEHKAGIPYDRMVLAGFSQGGALSLWAGMQLEVEKKLAGIVMMSGYLPVAAKFKVTPGLEKTPILQYHGTLDEMVKLEWATDARKRVIELTNQPDSYVLRIQRGLTHSVSIEEMEAFATFLKRRLPQDDAQKEL